MRRADQRRWASCRTLDDLCAVTIEWLNGEVEQTPGHLGPPAIETARIIPVLAAVNSAGFLTESSQPGLLTDDCQQRAAVSGFAGDEVLASLREAVAGRDLKLTARRPSAKRTRYTCRVVVSWRDGRPFTAFGAQLSREDLRWEYDICHADAVEAVCDAWQVTIIDPVYGRNETLWPALEGWASARAMAA